MLEKRRFVLIITLGLLIAAPTSSHACLIASFPVPFPPYQQIGAALSIVGSIFVPSPDTRRRIIWVDPINVDSFQLDVSFDTARVSYSGVEYVSPYVPFPSADPTVPIPPDLSRLGDGLLQDVAGYSSSSPPPEGEVYIFKVIFEDLRPDLDSWPVFTVFASSNDFIYGYNTETGDFPLFGPADIIPASIIPEPATLVLLGLGGLALLRRRRG